VEFFQLLLQVLDALSQDVGSLKVSLLNSPIPFRFQPLYLLTQSADFPRRRGMAEFDSGARFVKDINGFVRATCGQ
jgi:hypothetical protein